GALCRAAISTRRRPKRPGLALRSPRAGPRRPRRSSARRAREFRNGRSKQPHVANGATGYQPYIQVGQADGNKTGPGEQHVALVQTAQPLPGLVARRAESGAVEAVELSAGQVAQRVTGERVKA